MKYLVIVCYILTLVSAVTTPGKPPLTLDCWKCKAEALKDKENPYKICNYGGRQASMGPAINIYDGACCPMDNTSDACTPSNETATLNYCSDSYSVDPIGYWASCPYSSPYVTHKIDQCNDDTWLFNATQTPQTFTFNKMRHTAPTDPKVQVIADACVYQIKTDLIKWKSGKMYVRFNDLTNMENVWVNQGTGLGFTPGVVIPENATASRYTEYNMDIKKGNYFTITTLPKTNESPKLSFQYWIEGVQYTSGEQFWNKLTETEKGIRMLLLMACACILFCFVCCVTTISVSEKNFNRRKLAEKQRFSNSVGPATEAQIDPYHPMTEGKDSARSNSYVTPPGGQKKAASRAKAGPEEKLLYEFREKVMDAVGISIEAFYRMCDKKYAGSVSVDDFKNMVNKHQISMDGGTLSRVMQIMDEDCSGDITKQELYFALDLYSCNTEKVTDNDKLSPQLESVFKLMKVMKKKRINGDELFRMIDVDKNSSLALSELEDVLKSLEDDNSEFTKKEIKSIHDFFDINNDGEVSEKEFLSQVKDATKKHDQYLQRISLKW